MLLSKSKIKYVCERKDQMKRKLNPATFTREQIFTHVDYNAEKGILIRKRKGNKIEDYIGSHGKNRLDGYIKFKINYKVALVHRLIFFLETGLWPKIIDHINGNTLDNRISNLRQVDNRENQQNRKDHRNGRLVGAVFNKSTQKWRSIIKINKKQFYLGTYATQEEAHQAYMNKLKEVDLNSYNFVKQNQARETLASLTPKKKENENE